MAQRSRKISPQIRQQAVHMRREPTPAEGRLWKQLRAYQLNGLKFRRQHPLGGFIVDFCCIQRGLVVEIDGDVHAGREQRDEQRTLKLNGLGYRVMRFSNEDVNLRMMSVLEAILVACGDDPPPTPP